MIKIILLLIFPAIIFAQMIPERSKLVMAKIKITTDGSGYGSTTIKVPGIPGKSGERIISGGDGWFESQHPDDTVKVSLTDEDNLLGSGSGYMIGSFYDTEVGSGNQGWYVPAPWKVVQLSAIANLTHLTGGMYLKIEVQKGDNTVDTFRANIRWGEPE